MKFLFWQNMISIHQTALLKALAGKHQVTLAVQKAFEEERADSGWKLPDMGDVQLEISPDEQRIHQLILSNEDATHIFSGINAYPMVFRAFKECIRQKRTAFIYMEPYQTGGISGWLRRLKYAMLYLTYGKNIRALLATGKFGVKAYRRAGWPASGIFEWGYFTEQAESSADEKNTVQQNARSAPRLLFVGRLDNNKRILHLIHALKSFRSQIDAFTIIGTGPLAKETQSLVDEEEHFYYLGKQANEDVLRIMQSHDLLILPSMYDGWGAVINEALQQGMRVLCSDHCGASCLLDGIHRGGTFSWETKGSLERELLHWIRKGPMTPKERADIASWAKTTISGQAAACYLTSILSFIQGKTSSRPLPPWQDKI